MTKLLSLRHICRSFGGIQALDNVSLDVAKGDIVGLVGDNGAGKSTLIKILAGAHDPTSGEVVLEGQPRRLSPPAEAQRLGIETVYQDLSLIGTFTAAENFFLGRELALGRGPALLRWIRLKSMGDTAMRGLEELNIDIPGVRSKTVERMSGGQRQLVAIARGAFWGHKLLLLDEPTAALGVRESREVLDLIRRLGAKGLTIVMVTHNLDHLWQVCNRVVVMRRGRKAADLPSAATNMEEVVAYITGAKEAMPSLAATLEAGA
ncbi:ATP-binding cassette domain-containing protein [Mesorhizobium sp. YC-39]|uniref:ATP-binding cassette domain-containing protein n=1 Tax=unclassified Mesorhizobium TaxID=325217 RepID=UPI0021E91F18|nr:MULTISPECIES: ATP-binding cassette domain-containing protein [unclassified Mesorhizobium]MCV3210285.1 ATP-binding cassette domain-containing protein [Mesorhizobium sp. YC-2]MCV3230815.1 ATP-binding cassette domain-containing protein [Mesorhizobium sp. YC-39]